MPGARREAAIDAALWGLAACLGVAIVALSLGPTPPTAGVALADKVWHAGAYAALTSVLLLAAVWRPGRGPGSLPAAAPAVVVGVLALGAGLEAAQALDLVDRTADPWDLLADAAGAVAAVRAWTALGGRTARGPSPR